MSNQNLSAYIKSDLKNKILSKQCDHKLSLKEISKHYNVSTYPVRQAVETLIEEKILQKSSTGRLSVHPDLKHAKVSKDKVVKPIDFLEKISQDLIKQSLNGESDFIRENDTAAKYGISQNQIRQIFGHLNGLGLLEHIQRQGWKLRAFRKKDFLNYNHVREIMEHKALDLAKNNLDPQVIETFIAKNSYDQSNQTYNIDEGFHRYIVDQSDNRYIQDFFDRNGPYFKILSSWEIKKPNRAKITSEQHTEILSCVLKKNWSKAKKAITNHIQNNHPYFLADLKK